MQLVIIMLSETNQVQTNIKHFLITDRNEVIHTHNIHMYDMKEEGRYLERERGLVRGGTGEDNGGK